MKQLFYVFCMISLLVNGQQKLEIWPTNQMPNTKGLVIERIEENLRLKQTKAPELYYFPTEESVKAATVLIIPGGGYQHVTYGIYGFEFAKWLNQNEINAFVLNYRLPTSKDLIDPEIAPLQDAQMALKYIRKNYKTHQKIGVLGVSAGGHLVTQLSNSEDQTKLSGDWKTINHKPNYAILISPVIDFETYIHKGSVDNLLQSKNDSIHRFQFSIQHKINPSTAPTLLIHAIDDVSVPYQNSLLYFEKLQEHQIKSSLYLLPYGNHNLNLSNSKNMADSWQNIVIDWIKLLNK